MPPIVDLDACVADWRPKPAVAEDRMDTGPSQALAAVLDRAAHGGPWLPALWHWVHFLAWPPTAALGTDGHPADGDFLPPIPDRTRMFVGGRLECPVGLRTGVAALRRSEVTGRTVKHGRSGSMLFVTVRHEIFQDGTLALIDEQDLMYRSGAATPASGVASAPPSPGAPASGAPWVEPFVAGPVTLFRFSALTANSHRIHYDQPYATGTEGYPGLVVHGPLLAVALAGLAQRMVVDRRLVAFRYRFVRPVFAEERVVIRGRPDGDGAVLAVVSGDGGVRVDAAASYTAASYTA